MPSAFYGWMQGGSSEVTRQGSAKSGITTTLSNGSYKYTLRLYRDQNGTDRVALTKLDLRDCRATDLLYGVAGQPPEGPHLILPAPA